MKGVEGMQYGAVRCQRGPTSLDSTVAKLTSPSPRRHHPATTPPPHRLRDELSATRDALLDLRNFTKPQQHNDVLLRGLKVRNAYVDPLNVMQAEILKRLRTESFASDEEQKVLEDALKITINGIANGQKNTG